MQLVTGKTKLLGVIGNPIEHSLSPVMHNAAIEKLGVDYIYVPFAIKPEELEVAIKGFAAIGVQGFSITIPHKETIIPLLSEVSETAQLVGAVNTVWRTEKGWKGTNTDVEGFVSPLKSLERNWQEITPVILGNGGAARAVVVGLAELGCPEIHVFGRNQEKLEQFSQSWRNSRLHEAIKVHRWEELEGLVSKTKLLVNTTPVGMSPKVNQSPVDDEVIQQLSPNAIAYDLIYTPNPTQFLKQAQQQGAITIDGLEMLVQQGAVALNIWLQKSIPVEIMRQSLRKYLSLN